MADTSDDIARRGRELFERGQLRLTEAVRTNWATPAIPDELRGEVELDARVALIVVLAAARGLDDLYRGREGFDATAGYERDRPALLEAMVYAADKSVHLKLGVADIVAVRSRPGPHAYGGAAYGGRSSFQPVLRWPTSVPDRPDRFAQQDQRMRKVYEEHLQGEELHPKISELAAWFSLWWPAVVPPSPTTGGSPR